MKTKHEPGSLEALAEVIAARVKDGKRAKPKLRVVTTPVATLFDSITRDCCLTRIRRLSKAYHLHWLVEQATFNTPGLECLEDAQIIELLARMEKARECIVEDVPFDDAGLVQNSFNTLPERW